MLKSLASILLGVIGYYGLFGIPSIAGIILGFWALKKNSSSLSVTVTAIIGIAISLIGLVLSFLLPLKNFLYH